MVAYQLQGNHAGAAEPARAVVSRAVHGAPHRFTLSAFGLPSSRRGLIGPHVPGTSLHQYDAVSFPRRTTTGRSLLGDRADGRGNPCQGAGGPPARVVRAR